MEQIVNIVSIYFLEKIKCLIKSNNEIRVGKLRIVPKGGKNFFCQQNIENVLLIIKKE